MAQFCTSPGKVPISSFSNGWYPWVHFQTSIKIINKGFVAMTWRMCCQKSTPSDLQHTMTHVYHDIDPSIYFVVSLVAVRLNYKLVTKPYVFNYHFCLHFFSKLPEGNIITGVCLFTGGMEWVSLVPCPFWSVGISGTRCLLGGTHGAYIRMLDLDRSTYVEKPDITFPPVTGA